MGQDHPFIVTGVVLSLSEHRPHAGPPECRGWVKVSPPGHAQRTSGVGRKAVEIGWRVRFRG
jgi:hypothetical protein